MHLVVVVWTSCWLGCKDDDVPDVATGRGYVLRCGWGEVV